MNHIQLWLELIGTPERAKKLRARVDSLASIDDDARQCPTTVIFGADVSRKLYADPIFRPALDAWDNETVSAGDLRRWCVTVERGQYVGAIFYPDAAWLASQRHATIANASRAESLWRTRHQPTWVSRASNGRAPRLA